MKHLASKIFILIFLAASGFSQEKAVSQETKDRIEAERVWEQMIEAKGGRERLHSVSNMLITYGKSTPKKTAGAVSDMQLGNGKWESTTFNSRLQPMQIALGTVQGGLDKLKLNYQYNTGSNADNNGNVLEQKIKVEDVGTYQGFTATQTYTYDELNRIKTATETGTDGWTQTFQYA